MMNDIEGLEKVYSELDGVFATKIKDVAGLLGERMSAHNRQYRRERFVAQAIAAMKATLDTHLAIRALDRALIKGRTAEAAFYDELGRWEDVKDMKD